MRNHLFLIVFLGIAPLPLFVACDGEIEPSAPDGGTGSADGAPAADGTTTTPTPDTGSGAVDGGNPSPDGSPSTALCTKDLECNENIAMSSLAGTCVEGSCYCNKGFYVQLNGKCGQTVPGDCAAQMGACKQPTCAKGELSGDQTANMSCGDFVAAECCWADAACKGSTNVACCSKPKGTTPPICINGWRACLPGASPIKKTDVCN